MINLQNKTRKVSDMEAFLLRQIEVATSCVKDWQVQTPDMPASGWCCDLRRGEWVSKPSAHSSAPFPMICRECGEESSLSPEGFCQGCIDEIAGYDFPLHACNLPGEYDMEGDGNMPEEDYEEEEEPCALCGLPSAHSDFFYPHGPLCSCATALQDANEACLFMCDYSSKASNEAQEDLQVAYILASAPVKPHRRARSLPILSSRNLARLQDPKPETTPSALPVRSWRMEHLR